MSNLEVILESLENLKTKYVIKKDYEKAMKVREVIKLIKEKMEKQESTFLERIIKEKAELAEKTSKLKDFIENNPKFDELTNINRILLINQFNAMEMYLYALDSRIEFIND